MSAAVELRGVGYTYGGSKRPALMDASVTFPERKVTAIVGSNGSGKSTMLRIISGQLIPSDGTIFIDGVQVDDDNADQLIGKRVGMVFQNPGSQFVATTLRQDLAFGLENDCVPPEDMDAAILEAAKACGIEELLDREPDTLSGGQKQRAALAGILVRKPSILLLDEATSMLDPISRRGIFELLEKIEKKYEKLTVIEVTHDWKEAYKADYLVALDAGRVVYSGDPRRIFEDYSQAVELGLEPSFEASLSHSLKDLGIDVESFNSPEGLFRCLGLR